MVGGREPKPRRTTPRSPLRPSLSFLEIRNRTPPDRLMLAMGPDLRQRLESPLMILETTIRRLEPPKAPARHLVALPRPEREGNGRSGAVMMTAESGLALALLLLASPLILLLAVLVRLTSPGPSFYRQVRRGLYGRPFWIIKLR